jgi:hypothetical protein
MSYPTGRRCQWRIQWTETRQDAEIWQRVLRQVDHSHPFRDLILLLMGQFLSQTACLSPLLLPSP